MDIKIVMKLKPLIFRYLTDYYGNMNFVLYKQTWYIGGVKQFVPHNLDHDTPMTYEIQSMFGLDKRNANDVINQWFRRTYHTDLFSRNKTKILQKKLERWGK